MNSAHDPVRPHFYAETSRSTVMSWRDWCSFDATGLADLVRRREVSAQELASQAAAGVDIVNPSLNAVIEVFEDVVEKPYGDGLNPEGFFHGVPTMIKDIFSRAKGRKQEAGMILQKGAISSWDDRVTKNYREAGFNLMGRTTVPEAAWNLLTQSNLQGQTQSPWAPGYTSGGSSGGASAVVSSGVVPLAWASDGAGSTRAPASFTGLVGMKHTRGLVQMPLGANELSFPIASEGFLSRSVRDYARALDYLKKKDPGGTLFPLKEYEGSYFELLKQPLKRLHIAVSTGNWWREASVDPQTTDKVLTMAKHLESLGHSVFEVSDQDLFGEDLGMAREIFTSAVLTSSAKQRLRGTSREMMIEQQMTPNLMAATLYAHSEFDIDRYNIWASGIDQFLLRFGELFSRFDVLLCPVVPATVPHNQTSPLSFYAEYEGVSDWLERGKIWTDLIADHVRYTFTGNVLGFPGMSLPAGLDQSGLPIGVQYYAGWANDGLLLQLASELESSRPELFTQIPPFHLSHG